MSPPGYRSAGARALALLVDRVARGVVDGDGDELVRGQRTPEWVYRAYDRVVGPLTVPGLGHPLHRDEALAPFFIVGAGRSGTTLLRRLCTGHPGLHVPPEARIAQAIRVYRRNRRLVWEDLVRVTAGAFAFSGEFGAFQLDLRPVVGALLVLPPGERSLARILDAIYAEHARITGKPDARWGDKTPSNARFLPRIVDTFPRARVVHALRDGADVAVSSVRAGVAPDLERAGARWRTEALAAERWAERHPEQVMTLRYEDVVAAPERAARRLCGFLGVAYDPAMLEDVATVEDVLTLPHMQRVTKPIDTSSVGRGRDALTDAQRRLLAPVIGAALERLGYPPL